MNVKVRKAKKRATMMMMTGISSLRREYSSISNWKITRSLTLIMRGESQIKLGKRRIVESGKRCKRLHKRGNSRSKKSLKGLLTYST